VRPFAFRECGGLFDVMIDISPRFFKMRFRAA
jgi:hypothetical protein